MGRVVEVGLAERPLDPAKLEELLVGFEERLRKGVERRLRRRLRSMSILVKAELLEGGRRLQLWVEAEAAGRLIAPFSYEEVLAEAIDEAARWLEERLRARRDEAAGREAAGAGRGGGVADSGDGA